MSQRSEEIITDFIESGWESNPFEKTISLLKEQRDEALPLALKVLNRLQDGGTFFDFLLSHLTEAEFEELISSAVEGMENNSCSEATESVIAYASVQFPDLLAPHLRVIFSKNPNEGTYYEEWPWRSADDEEISILKKILSEDPDEGNRNKAWNCLVETHQPESIEFASSHFSLKTDEGVEFEAYAHLAGFDISGQSPRLLHTNRAHHIIFPDNYFESADQPQWMSHENHPTWNIENTNAMQSSFGGESPGVCGCCDGPLHRLLYLEKSDSILGISFPQIDLCSCLSCLGWEIPALFYVHDDSGSPTPFDIETEKKTPEFPAKALRASTVSIVQSPARWVFQDWALSNSRENLNRVGGKPSWIQDAQYPACPKCSQLMLFIAQIDSNIPTIDNDEWLWGSGGICYIFWCDSCAISGNLWQCT
ncbi:MAG: hypothetical protein COA78_26650 [Blastopirellula sp.]|nr:MAG: hypothetical protein COA78_26650 [Blastopirellula sp.]